MPSVGAMDLSSIKEDTVKAMDPDKHNILT